MCKSFPQSVPVLSNIAWDMRDYEYKEHLLKKRKGDMLTLTGSVNAHQLVHMHCSTLLSNAVFCKEKNSISVVTARAGWCSIIA